MKKFTVYDPRNGRILRSGECQDHMIDKQAGQGGSIIEAESDPVIHCVDLNTLQVVEKPPVWQEPHYTLRRVREYPSIGEQLEVIWKQLRQMPHCQEVHDMLQRIDDVKKANPKQ